MRLSAVSVCSTRMEVPADVPAEGVLALASGGSVCHGCLMM
jgi:hypothetical protein